MHRRSIAVEPPQGWEWFAAQPFWVQQEAALRHGTLEHVRALEVCGATRTSAIFTVSLWTGLPTRTIWSWFHLVDGVVARDVAAQLAALCPRRGIKRRRAR